MVLSLQSIQDQWSLRYYDIEGFDYVGGYVYVMRVRERIVEDAPHPILSPLALASYNS
ncbi:MAG: DUF4377 domain-containing protein [Deinococcales bacterium]